MPRKDPRTIQAGRFENLYAHEVLDVPVRGINFANILPPPEVDTFDGTYLFSPSFVNTAAGRIILPNRWKQETNIRPAVFWSKTSDDRGDVGWLFAYQWVNPGETPPDGPWHTSNSPELIVPEGGEDALAVTVFAPLETEGMRIGASLKFVLARSGGTYPNDAKLHSFKCGVTLDGFGTVDEFYKGKGS